MAFYLTYVLAFYLASILAVYLTFCLIFYLAFYLAFFYLAFNLAVYLAVEVQWCPLGSGGPGSGPAVLTGLVRSPVEARCALDSGGQRLRSSSPH